MKFLRLLLTCLAVVATLALVVALLVIAPAVQTWLAQREITGTPGVKGSLDSLSAGFGEVDVENLHLEANGAVLTLPSLKAKLTLSEAVVRRRFHIRSLVAKGWSLDLSHPGDTANPPAGGSATITNAGAVTRADAASVRRAVDMILAILSQRRLPFDGSLDGVDLEGEVLFTPIPGKETARVHVVLNGGGLSEGSEGVFNFDLTGTIPDTSLPVSAASAHGRLSVSMDGERALTRIRVDTELTDNSSSTQPSVTVGAEIAADKDGAAPTYHLEVSRAGRILAAVAARQSGPGMRLSGTWAVDFVDSDITRYFPDVPFPSGTLAGKGRFDSDPGFSSLHVVGTMASDVSHLEAVAPALKSVGPARIGWDFDDTRSGHQVRVDRLKVSISGARPVATVTSLQTFVIDEGNGAITCPDPTKDLLDISLVGLPLAWLPPADGLTISGGNATGDILVAQSRAGYDLRSKGELAATNVSLLDSGAVVGRGLNLGLEIKVHEDPRGWRADFAPLGVDCGGRHLASIVGSASRSVTGDAGVSVNLKWNADLDAVEAEGAAPGARWLTARGASGEISAHFGATTQVDGKVAVAGHDPSHSVTASVHAEIDPNGGVTFRSPVKIAMGPAVSDLTLDGNCGRDSGGPWVDLKIAGGKVALGDLAVLVTPFAPTKPASRGSRDKEPFWGNLTGRVVVSFDQFSTQYSELSNVGGTFTIDKGSIGLEGGRGGPAGDILTNVDGSIVFNASSDFPYLLKGTAASTELEASSFFAKPRSGEDPVFEGKVKVTRAYSGRGVNLYDLAAHSGEEFHISSSSGIVRLLKADVADSITEAPSSVASDTLSTVGSVVGTVMGTKRNILDSGKTKLSKNTEAVLDVTYQFAELGYDKMEITAFRGFDGAVALTQLEMVTPEVHLSGTGRIANAKGHSLADQALRLDLQLAAQGETADLMSRAALLSTAKDPLGYTMLGQTLHFGGTLNHVDTRQWNDLLVKAAMPRPETAKKGG